MKRHTVSLVVIDHDTGRHYSVYQCVESGELHDAATSDPTGVADSIQIALNPIICNELAEARS